MNKFAFPVSLFFITLMPQLCSGLEFSLRPRFNTGFQFFEYNQDAFSTQSVNGLISNSTSGIEFSDFVPFVSGGMTLFIDRFFIDGFVQYSFEGHDTNGLTNKNFVKSSGFVPTDTVINANAEFDINFDRLEYSFSLGYAITDQIVVYAGYKNAHTKVDAALRNGSLNSFFANNSAPNPFLSGTVTGRFNLDYEYDGAFIGGVYSQNIDVSFLQGALSANIAVAFLEGNVDVEFRDIQIINRLGVSQNVDVNPVFTSQNLKGDAVGVSAGLTWNGLTAIDGLNYLIGINGYRYEFDGKNSPDFAETVVRVDLGFSYTF